MDCLNACLLWPKPGSIKWQGPTPYMNHKKAQGGRRLDLRYEEPIKWSSWTPCIHHKTGPLPWPLQVFPAGTLLLQVFPLARFASEVPLASFCRSLLCKFPIGFKLSLQPDKPHGLPQCMLALVKPGTIKWEGPTLYMNHKKAQEKLMRLDLRYEEPIKWPTCTPWIHHKTGPLLWPLQLFPAGTLLL